MKKIMLLLVICLLVAGCPPSVEIQKTVNIEVLASFEEVKKPYRRIGKIEAVDGRTPKRQNRNETIEVLKTKARDAGADGVVITKEGTFKKALPDGMGSTVVVTVFFIKGVAIAYE
jgi:hypothetical protein